MNGCVYGLRDGLLKDLGVSVSTEEEIEPRVAQALKSTFDRYHR